MKFLKLYSDNPKFKTVVFNPGLTIVAGIRSSTLAKDSYNGIGKSTSLNLLHLMLGGTLDSKVVSDSKLKKFLSTYGNMYLDFKVEDVTHTIRKNFSETKFHLNEVELSRDKFSKELEKLVPETKKLGISLKALFNIFARRYLPDRNYYAGALTQQNRPSSDFYQRKYNLRLLGLDVSILDKNKEIVTKITNLKNTETSIKKQYDNVDSSNLPDLQEELDLLSVGKDQFIIAQNYDELKQTADDITQSMSSMRNELYANNKKIKKKQYVLSSSRDEKIDVSKISEIYNEAKFHFPEKINVRLEEAQNFHIKIQETRKARLQDQVNDLTAINKDLKGRLQVNETRRDKILKDLNSTGALEEYNSIVDRIRSLESEISKLTSYQIFLTKLESDISDWDMKKSTTKSKAIKYLEGIAKTKKDIQAQFRSFSKRFYRDHGGRLSITNAKDAQYLYDIEVGIKRDGSQGVNEVKIFCYDLLLFTLNPNALGFIAHDSAIFSGMDPRQKATLFKIILEMTETFGLQYFVNINMDTYDQILSNHGMDEDDESVLTDDEREKIRKGTVLKLFDESPDQTLFGEIFG